MPKTPAARHRVRLYNKLIDEYMHNACTIMTFATAFRPRFLKSRASSGSPRSTKPPSSGAPNISAASSNAGWISEFVIDALSQHQKMISWMAEDLRRGPYLAGDAFTNADCAVISYILRLELLKLGAMWQREPAVADWWTRVRDRPSVKAAIFDRMLETDWAPFRNLAPDPWPKVQNLLKAADRREI